LKWSERGSITVRVSASAPPHRFVSDAPKTSPDNLRLKSAIKEKVPLACVTSQTAINERSGDVTTLPQSAGKGVVEQQFFDLIYLDLKNSRPMAANGPGQFRRTWASRQPS
jgi:hypothetical protein